MCMHNQHESHECHVFIDEAVLQNSTIMHFVYVRALCRVRLFSTLHDLCINK